MFGKSFNQRSKTREWNNFSIQISIQTSHQKGQDFTQCVLVFSISTGFEIIYEIFYVLIQQSHLISWVKKVMGFTYMSEKYLLCFVQSYRMKFKQICCPTIWCRFSLLQQCFCRGSSSFALLQYLKINYFWCHLVTCWDLCEAQQSKTNKTLII